MFEYPPSSKMEDRGGGTFRNSILMFHLHSQHVSSFISAWPREILTSDAVEWERGFSKLTEYKSEHGDARVPTRFKTFDGFPLGQ